MATSWSITGEYMEACSCDFLCPCIVQNMTTAATHDFCNFAMTFAITTGHFGDASLAGVRFAVIGQSKAVMSQGEWALGVIVDGAATEAQAAAIGAIASGQAGGPLAGLAPLVTDFRGVTRAPIEFLIEGQARTVRIAGQLEQTVQGVPSVSTPGECIAIDHTLHPANRRLNLATALKNVISCFGISWNTPSNRTNGHFAPFSWAGQG